MIVLDQKERCGNWALARIPGVIGWGDWYQTIGWERDGELIAVAVYNCFSGADIEMHIAAIPGKRWLTREALRAAFRYPFVQLGVRRITGCTPAKNTAALSFNKGLGFKVEGVKVHGMPDDDIVVQGMLKENCRWL